MAHGGDVVEELRTDHREVEELFGRIEELPSGDSRRKEYADLVTVEPVRHSVAEEAYLCPAVRRHVRNGDAVADREPADHTAAERTMKDLERCAAGDPEFDRLIARSTAEIRHHVRDEESNLFPQLVKSCSAEVLNGLG
ncbi:hemerythrin domain-containing protein, partial [Streptomyces sp. ND04-05B]|uniref:hemerythrin domain-containing protein n=1 Tax=Streptomyces sp. ND04-05B TaxID=3028693 RepID=UPI0029B9BBC4